MQSSGSRCHSLLKEQFPLQFANGYHIDTIGFWCKKCTLIAHPDTVQGTVSRIVATTVDVRAVVNCPCGYHSEYLIRLKDDKSYAYLDETGWHAESGKLSIRRRFLLKVTNELFNLVIFIKHRKIKRKLQSLRTWLKTTSQSS